MQGGFNLKIKTTILKLFKTPNKKLIENMIFKKRRERKRKEVFEPEKETCIDMSSRGFLESEIPVEDAEEEIETLKEHSDDIKEFLDEERKNLGKEFIKEWMTHHAKELKKETGWKEMTDEQKIKEVRRIKGDSLFTEELQKQGYSEFREEINNLTALAKELEGKKVLPPDTKCLLLNRLNKKAESLNSELNDKGLSEEREEEIRGEQEKLLETRKALYEIITGKKIEDVEEEIKEEMLGSVIHNHTVEKNTNAGLEKLTEKRDEARKAQNGLKRHEDLKKKKIALYCDNLSGWSWEEDEDTGEIKIKEGSDEKSFDELESAISSADKIKLNLDAYKDSLDYIVRNVGGKVVVQGANEKKIGEFDNEEEAVKEVEEKLKKEEKEKRERFEENEEEVKNLFKKLGLDESEISEFLEGENDTDIKQGIRENMIDNLWKEKGVEKLEEKIQDLEPKKKIKDIFKKVKKRVIGEEFLERVDLKGKEKKDLAKIAQWVEEEKKTPMNIERVVREISGVYNKIRKKEKAEADTLYSRTGYGKRKLSKMFRSFNVGIRGPEIRNFMRQQEENDLKEALRRKDKFVRLIIDLIEYMAETE